jgi:hypothetical protein
MRKLSLFGILIVLFYSCTTDPSTDHNGKDSLLDTLNNTIGANDTFQVDSGNVSSTYYDCAVLNRKVPDDTNQNQIRRDLSQLVHCGVDSFDFLYVVPNLFPGFVSENHIQGKSVTYGEFVKHLNEFKGTPAYAQLHMRVSTLDSLRSTPFDASRIFAMKPTLGKLGFTEDEWDMFSGFANSYPVPKKGTFTWGNMLEAFDKYKPK